MDGPNIVICFEIYMSENEKSSVSLSTGVLELYPDGRFWCFSHGWSLTQIKLFVESLVFKCWVYGFFQIELYPTVCRGCVSEKCDMTEVQCSL